MNAVRPFGRISVGRLALAAALLGSAVVAGCDTYHYYDIDVSFGSITEEEASVLQNCELVVTGAASHTSDFPNGSGSEKSVCPISNNWPNMGTFEFTTFADSGKITFTVNGYKTSAALPANLCTSGSITLDATGTITTTGSNDMITLGNFDDSNCPTSVVSGNQ